MVNQPFIKSNIFLPQKDNNIENIHGIKSKEAQKKPKGL
jgi:hypothetical protein